MRHLGLNNYVAFGIEDLGSVLPHEISNLRKNQHWQLVIIIFCEPATKLFLNLGKFISVCDSGLGQVVGGKG